MGLGLTHNGPCESRHASTEFAAKFPPPPMALPVKRFAPGIRAFASDESGATLVEYGILLLIVAALSVVTIRSIGSKVSKGFETVNSTLP